MKIWCDVCEKDEASVFCVADEAALCYACDRRVHHANKLAGKHHRFSLLLPSPKQLPLCDICQERRAFLFCQEDRAILCRECDIPIHKANEHTQKHSRFLLTGVKISPNVSLHSSEAAVPSFPNASTKSSETLNQNSRSKPIAAEPPAILSNPTHEESSLLDGQMLMNGGQNGPISSISEYLIEMPPGMHAEDLLDLSFPFGFCKNGGSDGHMMPFGDADFGRNLSSFCPKSSRPWVPQTTTSVNAAQNQSFSTLNMPAFGDQISFKDTRHISVFKPSRKRSDETSFAVPQINPSSTVSSKRFRTLW